ncbi:MAG: hypothetical protein A2504_17340 [Bdellovibrionales bacterium RIFOXYD12_FULL_39_22]|nr:MAG: hypothetical protein A2385_10620 [Bdellovibrionales bacterium RIFOXYB1_FULL_39_21]OFZ40770.1 MAG: hypothetical protein A2485_17110 [Bdellovibrionales bacterium RIFOXYC12_FULL_39_17]OFZ48192.1 MAG: hypothetical protein A2404_17270 [Bdellovibrionales bacterium RIFOXYC1_FULL_39_130]OFZ75018.1 MAG: hypothetical protein A2451_05650 [Bdellovibrionales bacterium RIFOXYC2_FULL_39_8]OFZ75842.1 MAG: hypothetical protein A2560_13770 [Bdellovibrionales bacterium RIFOXYD1_FULL_39_84]OFZ91903.1 MAG:
MKITFIMPSIGRKADTPSYLRTWQMEPLPIATLAALTPPAVEREFFDDRMDEINFETKTDLVAITVETYTARRSYEISYEFRKRGIPVIMGGFHPTLVPDEVAQYADSVFIGEAEGMWQQVLTDLKLRDLKKTYRATRPELYDVVPDRSIFKGKKYLNLGLIETGRGCAFNCDFCTIQKFYKKSYRYRQIEGVIKEISALKYRFYFFVDDNIVANPQHAKELFRALIPLKIQWFTQGSINMSDDPEMLDLMKQSGCVGVLIGFESLNDATLSSMNKNINLQYDRDKSIMKLYDAGIRIYATFVFGNDNDTREDFDKVFEFALRHRMFITAFNHLVPFPGTDLYTRLKNEGRLRDEKYWLNHDYHFGDVSYHPKNFSHEELRDLCFSYRNKFYSWGSILKRLFNRTNFRGLLQPFFFIAISALSRKDAKKRQGLPMGMGGPIA